MLAALAAVAINHVRGSSVQRHGLDRVCSVDDTVLDIMWYLRSLRGLRHSTAPVPIHDESGSYGVSKRTYSRTSVQMLVHSSACRTSWPGGEGQSLVT